MISTTTGSVLGASAAKTVCAVSAPRLAVIADGWLAAECAWGTNQYHQYTTAAAAGGPKGVGVEWDRWGARHCYKQIAHSETSFLYITIVLLFYASA
jgi:hypothetical protein